MAGSSCMVATMHSRVALHHLRQTGSPGPLKTALVPLVQQPNSKPHYTRHSCCLTTSTPFRLLEHSPRPCLCPCLADLASSFAAHAYASVGSRTSTYAIGASIQLAPFVFIMAAARERPRCVMTAVILLLALAQVKAQTPADVQATCTIVIQNLGRGAAGGVAAVSCTGASSVPITISPVLQPFVANWVGEWRPDRMA